MILTIIGIVVGGFFSWIITHAYYKKGNDSIPAWAKSLIEKLPENVPSEKELLKLFQEEISNGNIKPHSVFSHVACPNCYTPLDELEEGVYGDDYHTILEISCPNCGWRKSSEV